jgi:hypothetical protein
MLRSPRTVFWRWPTLLLLIALSAGGLGAQVNPGFDGFMTGIRAKAVTGTVTFQRGEARFDLEPGIRLEGGGFIRTSVEGYAELLLQPGNYLRVGGDSECQIFSDQHDKMRLKLNRGTMNIEIPAAGIQSNLPGCRTNVSGTTVDAVRKFKSSSYILSLQENKDDP